MGDPVTIVDTEALAEMAARDDVPVDVRAALATAAIVLEGFGGIIRDSTRQLEAVMVGRDHLYSLVQALLYEQAGAVFLPDVVVLTADPADLVEPQHSLTAMTHAGAVPGRWLTLNDDVMRSWRDRVLAYEMEEPSPPDGPEQYAELRDAMRERSVGVLQDLSAPVDRQDLSAFLDRKHSNVTYFSPDQVRDLYGLRKQPADEFVAGCDEGAIVTTADEAVAATLMAPDEVTIPDLLGNLATSVEEARDARARHMTALCTCGKPRSMHHFVAGQGYVGPCLSPDPANTCVAFELAVAPNPLGGQLVIDGEVVMAESYMPAEVGGDPCSDELDEGDENLAVVEGTIDLGGGMVVPISEVMGDDE